MYQDYAVVPEAAKTPVWINGKLIPWNEAVMHLATHIINYGVGVFEGIRMYEAKNGLAIFHLDDHLDRMEKSINFIGIDSQDTRWSKSTLAEACKEVARASKNTSGYLRPQVQFGLSKLSLASLSQVDATVLYWALGKYRDKEELAVVISDIQRLSPAACPIQAKVAGYYVNSHFNHEFAKSKGVDEAIMLDINGNVAEASSSNIFYVKDDKLFTPKTGYILKGITRKSILTLANDLGIETSEKEIKPEELLMADEIFLTGTAAEVDPVVEINGQKVGTGEKGVITTQLKERYQKATKGELEEYDHWITYV